MARMAATAARLAHVGWLLLLVLPAATTFSAWHEWDISPAFLLATTCWVVVCLRLLVPGALFFVVTYPVALFGAYCVAADVLRNVDLLDLALQWRTFSATEVQDALKPYASVAIGIAVVLGLGCVTCCVRHAAVESILKWPWKAATLIAGTAMLFAAAPHAVWARAWPLNTLVAVAAVTANAPGLSSYASHSTATSPRTDAPWHASRGTHGPGREIVVLVIGESVRGDYLSECGGPRGIRAVRTGALVACDVTAGSDATHTSVPLLISREVPGHDVRVSDDSSFLRAFQETGFATAWYGSQPQTIAWPDAMDQRYVTGSDEALLPLVQQAIAPRGAKAAIVLHVTGAHEPYCSRFDRRSAPLPDTCDRLAVPSSDAAREWREAYGNAVDASVGFVNELISLLERSDGEVFLVFTSDHGENLFDDDRRLFGHALRHPSRWDINVPAVFWANETWKTAHPEQWATLQSNSRAPLAHADLVPTLLGAAGIRYSDPRPMAFDLLAGPVQPRRRDVQVSIGRSTSWESLLGEAR